ncbi:hypothetical protein BDV18DRAFT_88333 [Aspergillus unguis]
MTNPRYNEATVGLLLLPPEIRLHIYRCLFSSMRLASGYKTPTKRIKPALHSLAILRACRLIHQEAQSAWLPQVLFAFETLEDMLDKFSSLPAETLSQIRHLRVSSRARMPWGRQDHGHDHTPARVLWCLQLFPALRLNTFTYFNGAYADVCFETLRQLILRGSGWRELRYITQHTGMLQVERLHLLKSKEPWPKPWPTVWHGDLLRRDGVDSGASIKLYTSRETSLPNVIVNSKSWETWEEDLVRLEEIHRRGFSERQPLLRREELGRELLVVVRRGEDADILQVGEGFFRGLDTEKTWAEIKQGSGGSDISNDNVDVEYDVYTDRESFAFRVDHS